MPSTPDRRDGPPSPLRQIDLAADRFEQEWRLGRRPPIASFLDQVPAGLRLRLLAELVCIDLEHRLRGREAVTLDDYFRQFPGLDASARFNHAGFWELPVPVTSDITVHPDDVLIFDVEGYKPLKEFLQRHGVRHVLLVGYATDMCFCKTTAGYENLSKDFNVFLVGDATLATRELSHALKVAPSDVGWLLLAGAFRHAGKAEDAAAADARARTLSADFAQAQKIADRIAASYGIAVN